MRFFVQVTPIGKVDTHSYCVEADSWQKALQGARTLRKEEAPISGFSIELTEDGCRAVDPSSRLRYVVKKAPANAKLTDGAIGETTRATAQPRAGNNVGKSSGFGSTGAVLMRSDSKISATGNAVSVGAASAAAVLSEDARASASLPPPDDAPHVLYRREQEPSTDSPLFYREDVYVMPDRTSEAEAERYLRVQFASILHALSGLKPGKYVNLAVFDRAFEGRPPSPPLATLSWKDWKGNEPVVTYPRRGVVAPAPVVPTQPSAKPPVPFAQPAGARQSGVRDSATGFPVGARPSQPLAEAAAEATATVARASLGFDHAPAKAGDVPSGFDHAPAKAGDVPSGFDHAPAKAGDRADGTSALSSVAGDLSPPQSIAEIGEALRRAGSRPSPPMSSPPPGILALGQAIDRATSQPPPALATDAGSGRVPSVPPTAPSAHIASTQMGHAGQAMDPSHSGGDMRFPPPPRLPTPIPPRPAIEPTESIIVAGPVEPQTVAAAARTPSVIPPAPIPAAGSPSVPPPAIFMHPQPSAHQPPPPEAAQPTAPQSTVRQSTPPPRAGLASEPRQRISERFRVSEPRQRISSRPSFSVRGDELIAVLFEAMHDLHFAQDALEAADFCLQLALEKIPSRAAVAHFYDVDKREYVIVSAFGAGTEQLVLRRHPPTDPLLAAAMRKRSALVLSDATKSDEAFAERFEILGGAKSIIVAPVMLGGRALAAIEIINPLDGLPFVEAEGNALSYMGEQFAEYVSSHGLVLDPERIKRRT